MVDICICESCFHRIQPGTLCQFGKTCSFFDIIVVDVSTQTFMVWTRIVTVLFRMLVNCKILFWMNLVNLTKVQLPNQINLTLRRDIEFVRIIISFLLHYLLLYFGDVLADFDKALVNSCILSGVGLQPYQAVIMLHIVIRCRLLFNLRDHLQIMIEDVFIIYY